MLDPTTGEVIKRRLEHQNGEAKKFYATLPGPARVGMEATCDAQWFERTLREHNHELWIGDAAEIRAAKVRKQKTDPRDALHILDLLLTNRFPRDLTPRMPGPHVILDRHRPGGYSISNIIIMSIECTPDAKGTRR